MATLTVVGGLPAVGKTAVCREVLRLRAEARPRSRPPTWLRIDSIEQALRDSGEMLPGMPAGAGYYVAAAVARAASVTVRRAVSRRRSASGQGA